MQFLQVFLLLLSFVKIIVSQSADDYDSEEMMDNDQQQQINRYPIHLPPTPPSPCSREAIEAILNLVSPSCKSEMEAAIESQTDVTSECKVEIQQAVQIISGYNRREEQEQGQGEQQPSTPPPPPPRDGIHPGYWIAAFVVVLVGGVTAYVIHVNKLLEEAFPPKPVKKLSKKKVSHWS